MHAFHNYYPIVGGMERVVQGLAEAQAVLGHDVFVVTSKYNSTSPSYEFLNGVHIYRLNSVRFGYPDFTAPKKVPQEILKGADIVHAHGHISLFSQKILAASAKYHIITACYFMAVNAFHDHPNFLVKTFGPYYAKKNTINALKNTNVKLVKSFRDLKALKDNFSIDAFYLPDAIDNSLLDFNAIPASEFKERFGIKQQKFFLFVGRMHKLKGPDILVKALKFIDPDIAAVFIGPDDGYLGQTLKLAEALGVRNRVYVLGHVDEAAKIAAIDASLAVVNPSIADHVEVFSIVVSEAWARKKPVIASRVGELSYRVKDHVNGLLVDPSNPKMLADAMVTVVKNKDASEQMGVSGKTSVLSWESTAKKSVGLYERISLDLSLR